MSYRGLKLGAAILANGEFLRRASHLTSGVTCLFRFFREYSSQPVRPVVGRAYDIAAKYIRPDGRLPFPDFRLLEGLWRGPLTGVFAPDGKREVNAPKWHCEILQHG
jgi:hypothetical protein